MWFFRGKSPDTGLPVLYVIHRKGSLTPGLYGFRVLGENAPASENMPDVCPCQQYCIFKTLPGWLYIFADIFADIFASALQKLIN